MKKRIFACLTAGILSLSLLTGCAQDSDKDSSKPEGTAADQTEEKEPVKVTLNEVAHSIFYAPMYVAIEEGYFEDEGIALDLVCGFGDSTVGKDIIGKMIQYSTPERMPRGIVMQYTSAVCRRPLRVLRHIRP